MIPVNEALWTQSKANRLSPRFEQKYNNIVQQFFSRDPRHWPIYQLAELGDLVTRRKFLNLHSNVSMAERLETESRIPQHSSDAVTPFDPLALYTANMSKNWEDPASVENVVTTPCDPAIHGAMLATIANPNLVSRQYAGGAVELEQVVIRQIANLVGYDDKTATGLFTQGGTFCNLYGYLLGLRKAFPGSSVNGLSEETFCMMNSEAGHYSNMTDLALLGVSINKQVMRIKVNRDNQIDTQDFKRRMIECVQKGIKVPTILLTCGTTDTFAIDDVEAIYHIREAICHRYNLSYKPHIHVDAAVGWSLMFFNEYNFDENKLDINPATLYGLETIMPKVRSLRFADSITIDFQKWGYVPYTSSMIIIKNGDDMEALKQDPRYFTYFDPKMKEDSHLQSTIECSRSAVGVFSAYSALSYIGIEGYQLLMAYCMQNANYLRYLLSTQEHCRVVSASNQGPSVTFRLYHPDLKEDPYELFDEERRVVDDEFFDSEANHAAYHRKNFTARRGRCLHTNWVESIAHTDYNSSGYCLYLPGEKAVFFNPHTTRDQIRDFVEHLYFHRHRV
ncbi:pyridoxal phosphate-dependent decarboxylase family protein [Vibrio sp. HN007]|uniref:pyridoxal phosphate-dependent decarboxylase family protein n=1 Tax=Vibrio iocasae TaxID=3098914 RepID=UPI0035D4278C